MGEAPAPFPTVLLRVMEYFLVSLYPSEGMTTICGVRANFAPQVEGAGRADTVQCA